MTNIISQHSVLHLHLALSLPGKLLLPAFSHQVPRTPQAGALWVPSQVSPNHFSTSSLLILCDHIPYLLCFLHSLSTS